MRRARFGEALVDRVRPDHAGRKRESGSQGWSGSSLGRVQGWRRRLGPMGGAWCKGPMESPWVGTRGPNSRMGPVRAGEDRSSTGSTSAWYKIRKARS